MWGLRQSRARMAMPLTPCSVAATRLKLGLARSRRGECASLRSLARPALPACIGPSTRSLRAPRGASAGARFWDFRPCSGRGSCTDRPPNRFHMARCCRVPRGSVPQLVAGGVGAVVLPSGLLGLALRSFGDETGRSSSIVGAARSARTPLAGARAGRRRIGGAGLGPLPLSSGRGSVPDRARNRMLLIRRRGALSGSLAGAMGRPDLPSFYRIEGSERFSSPPSARVDFWSAARHQRIPSARKSLAGSRGRPGGASCGTLSPLEQLPQTYPRHVHRQCR